MVCSICQLRQTFVSLGDKHQNDCIYALKQELLRVAGNFYIIYILSSGQKEDYSLAVIVRFLMILVARGEAKND